MASFRNKEFSTIWFRVILLVECVFDIMVVCPIAAQAHYSTRSSLTPLSSQTTPQNITVLGVGLAFFLLDPEAPSLSPSPPLDRISAPRPLPYPLPPLPPLPSLPPSLPPRPLPPPSSTPTAARLLLRWHSRHSFSFLLLTTITIHVLI